MLLANLAHCSCDEYSKCIQLPRDEGNTLSTMVPHCAKWRNANEKFSAGNPYRPSFDFLLVPPPLAIILEKPNDKLLPIFLVDGQAQLEYHSVKVVEQEWQRFQYFLHFRNLKYN
uniref:Uncharacterized protein n=1 Tax=Glossina brevipalpis TaxID=37001 RepID=A0A1A9X2P1_9MUSC